MKRVILLFIVLSATFSSLAQVFVPRTNGTFTPVDPYLYVSRAFYAPKVCDTLVNPLKGGKDSVGAIIYDTCSHILYVRDIVGVTKFWKSINGSSGTSQGLNSVLTVGNIDTNKTIQFGSLDSGFVQVQQDSPTDTSWVGEPIIVNPYGGNDTATDGPRLMRMFRVQTHRYDITQPRNCIVSTYQFGSESIGKPYVRVGATEQDWYNNYEHHFLEFKLLGDAAAKRIGSATMNRTTGVGTITWRMGQQIFSDLNDVQMLALNNGVSTLRASNTLTPAVNLDLQSTDGTNGGLRISIPTLGQTLYNWHPLSGAFHVNLWDLPYQLIMGTSRTVNSSDAEYDIRFASRLKNNRFLTYKNANSFLMVMQVDSDSLNSVTVGGDHFMQNGSFSLMAKSLRNKNQKQFAIAIASNAADTFYYKVPFATDTLGRIAVNLPDPNEAVKDGLLGLTETEDFRVYGKSIVVDNTAGLNRLLTLKNTNAGNFSGSYIKFWNNVGTSGTNGYDIQFLSNGTSAPYTNAALFVNREGGPHVWYGQSAELGRFNDNGHFLVGTTTDGSQLLQVAGTAFISGNATFGTTNSIVGTTGTEDATAGNIGERIVSTVSTYTNYSTTATYQNIGSITLTAGDWDISALGTFYTNSATITAASDAIFLVGTVTASATGSTEGVNVAYIPQATLLGTSHQTVSIAPFDVHPSTTTTYYFNTQATFTVGNPQFVGTIRAKRTR